MNSQTRVGLYLRMSLDVTGEGLGVQRQRDACEKLARDRGWEIAQEYVDNSVSASDRRTDRPAYDRMRKDFDDGAFDALICWDLDRLTRQPRQLEDWIDAAEERGLKLVTANGEADLTTDGGRMYARIKAAVARAEVERKSARQIAAARQRAQLGRPPVGARLTGYTTKGEVIPDEAEVVRRIFELFLQRNQLKQVARRLEDEGHKTRTGVKWGSPSVRSILTNPRYVGRAVYRGQDTGIRGNWEPLVSDEDYDRVQAILRDPARRTMNVDPRTRVHLGSGLFYCECGRKVRTSGGNSNKKGARFYRCSNACYSRSMGPIDALVIEVVRNLLKQPRLSTVLAQRSMPDLGPIMAELERARERLHSVESDYDEGLIDGRRFKIATDKANEKIGQLARSLASYEYSTVVGDLVTAPDPVDSFENLDLLGKREVIDTLVKVTILRVKQGKPTFDPESVQIGWRFEGEADDE